MLDLLFTGFYPPITWMAFVIAGMALARLDLSQAAVQWRLAALGAGLTVAAYGMSLLLAGKDALRSTAEDGPSSSSSGSMPLDSGSLESQASSLLTAGPHSGTTFDIIGSVGVAILMIVGATAAMDPLPRLRRLATPVIAMGTMSLTAYVGHFVAQSALSMPSGTSTQQSWVPLLMFVLGTILFTAIWSRFFRRGPLEYLLNAATKPAKRIR
ncbi:hypothetical protein GCM10010256_75240 [Streptomyces coeruleorubidus]|nr:hypothetical protein GCM10010256_75240 [Streptomyces coeruleorubidus]